MITVTVSLKGRTLSAQTFDGKEPIRIGRSADNEVHLDNTALSRRHAVIVGEGRAFAIRDLESGNGVFVNGKRVSTHHLNPGDVIGIGKFTIVVELHGRTARGAAPERRPDAPPGLDGTQALLNVTLRGQPPKGEARPGAPVGHLVTAGGPLELQETAFFVGRQPDSQLRVPGLLTPPRVAIIVAGQGGFSVTNLARPDAVLLNGLPVDGRAWLRDGDRLRFAGRLEVTFKAGLPASG